jgi:two-component system chemotaxis response regulator CheY
MTKTVLSVDDSASIRDMVAFALGSRGYNVVKAVDGQDGLKQMAETKVDLVVTDLNMPTMNGIEMIKAIRADGRYDGVPIVMLTTEAQKDKMMEGKSAGATGWIVKPFDEQKLCGVVSKLIG